MDYHRLNHIQQSGAFFVIRVKENITFNRVYSQSIHKQISIKVDQTKKFTHQKSHLKYPKHLRGTKFCDRENDEN